MADEKVTRRDFVRTSVAAAGVAAGVAGAADVDTTKILNYNENMEYRRLGKTGLMVSAVSLGGHWKRVDTMVPGFKGVGYGWVGDIKNPDFLKNRHAVVSRCIEVGINYVDACSGEEILVYSQALKGRRGKMYLGFSWYEKESRFPEWRSTEALLRGLDEGMKQAGLDYVDLWRISLLTDSHKHTEAEIEAAIRALEKAKQQGKARFTGVSSHDRPHIKTLVETYPRQMEAVLTPYHARSKRLPKDSLFDALQEHDVGLFGIKPFANNSIFKGDSSLDGPHAQEDDERARLAIRHILCNPAITAPIPGLINLHQVDNVAKAVAERRQLDLKEQARLERFVDEAWATLPPDYQWLKDWDGV